jgi:hypothetical protein
LQEREETQEPPDPVVEPDVQASRRRPPKPNPRQVRFAVELAKRGGVGAIEAARAAGYSETVARRASWQLLRKPHVRELVEKHLRAETAALEVTAARVLGQAMIWAFMSDKEALARGWDISPGMRTKALELLAKATGVVGGDTHQYVHLGDQVQVQFYIPANDRVPVEGEVIDERGEPLALPPPSDERLLEVLDLPPKEDEG